MSQEATISVQVTQVPGYSQAVLIPDGGTVGAALEQASIDPTGMNLRVAGEAVTADRTLRAGDHVVVSRQIKGNLPTEASVSVQVTQVPGSNQAILVPDGGTVRDALNSAGIDPTGLNVRVSGESATLDRTLRAGDHIVVSRQIKGN